MAVVDAMANEIARKQQVEIPIEHHLFAGVYSRTARIPAGVEVVGAQIVIDTQLLVSGDVSVFYGADQPFRLVGTHMLEASAGRKQVFIAHSDTTLTMLFATSAVSVEDAENEFTHEANNLQTRKAAQCQA